MARETSLQEPLAGLYITGIFKRIDGDEIGILSVIGNPSNMMRIG